MLKNLILHLFGLLVLLYTANAAVERFCQPFADSSPIPFPKLPSEFQAHVEATIKKKNNTQKINEYYDQNGNIASVILIQDSFRFQAIYDYNKDLVYYINGKTCTTAKLSAGDNSDFFSIHLNGDGTETIGTPPEIFHFNNGFGTKYIGAEVHRGIPVTHWQSCQDWPRVNANILIDFYFTAKNYNSSVIFGDITEIPVVIKVTGIANIDDNQNYYEEVLNEYSFFDFKSAVIDRDYAFNPPNGVYCPGVPFDGGLPMLRKQYRYTEETLLPNGQLLVAKIYYDYVKKAVRIDTQYTLKLPPPFSQDQTSIIHDFNSGVGYIYDKYTKNCTRFSLGQDLFDIDIDTSYTLHQLQQNLGYSIRMRDPQQFLYLDETYYYAGERYIRGIKCNVFISNRTDYIFPDAPNVNYTYFEWYILPRDWYDESSDEAEGVIPIALIITLPELNITIVNNIYDFDQAYIPLDDFDISQCYSNREKSEFAISFAYTGGVDEESFRLIFAKLALEAFDVPLYSTFIGYNVSPLRIISPRIVPYKDRFQVITGLTEFATPILQFTKFGSQSIDLNMVVFKIASSSPENCAAICINATRLVNDKFICYSFDYCPNSNGKGGICSFYNASHITDPSLVITSDNKCDHYTKNTESFDSLPRDFAIKEIRNAVIQKQFNISITNADHEIILSFPGFDITEDIFGGNNFGGGGGGGAFGGSFGAGFLREFAVFKTPAIYNEQTINLNQKLFFRQRTLVSVNECARLCTVEVAFQCESFTYDYKNFECKWTNVEGDADDDLKINVYLQENANGTTAWYIRDPIYHYIRFPFRVTQDKDIKLITNVNTETQCARFCDRETNFTCRSFNYCNNLKECILSQNHIHNPDKNPNVISNPVCVHFSKRTINDFELIPQLEIVNLKPASKLYNTSLEVCAALCAYEDTYLCRSFTFYTDNDNCYLYRENLVDKVYFDIQTKQNPVSNHYSRLYYTINGVTYTITATGGNTQGKKYSGGAIFGILIALMIGFLTLGFLAGYTYKKIRGENAFDVKMKFENPNYKKQPAEQ